MDSNIEGLERNNHTSWKQKDIFNIGTWNVQGTGYKDEQFNKLLNKNNIKIAATSESKKKSRGSKLINNYIQIYSGIDSNERLRAGVAFMVHKTMQTNW
jgi:hypothetical protein